MAKPDRSSFRKIARAEQREVSKTTRQLGVLWTTAEYTSELVSLLADSIAHQTHAARSTEEMDKGVAATLFLRAAARTFTLEILSIARRHWIESLLMRRRVMELFACARIVWTDPKAAANWREAKFPQPKEPTEETPARHSSRVGPDLELLEPVPTDLSWVRYERAFGTNQLVNALDQLAPKQMGLGRAHKLLSKLVHPSFRGIVPSLTSLRTDPINLYAIDVFDDHAFERPGLVHAIKAERMLETNAVVIALVDGFATRGFERRPWTQSLRRVASRIRAMKDRATSNVRHYWPLLERLNHYRDEMKQEARKKRRPK